MIHSQALRVALVAMLCWPCAGFAGDAPAVSAINGKLSAEGGCSYSQSTGLGMASLAVPLGHDFGAQFDAGVGRSDYHSMWGTDGQVFWRDPSIALFGAGYVHTRRAGADLNRFLGVTELTLAGSRSTGRPVSRMAMLDTAQLARSSFRITRSMTSSSRSELN